MHLHLNKPAVADFYMTQARRSHLESVDNGMAAVHQTPGSRAGAGIVVRANCLPELLYNHGIVLLQQQRYGDAYDCLLFSSKVFHASPFLWLRLAECCLAQHAHKEVEQLRATEPADSLFDYVGSGPSRKALIDAARTRIQHHVKGTAEAREAQDDALSITSALLHLSNAMSLVAAALAADDSARAAADAADKRVVPQPVQLMRRLNRSELVQLKCHILANQAYAELAAGNSLVALDRAQQLLGCPTCPGLLRHLARLYVAEALIMLGRVTEALEHLDPDSTGDLSVGAGTEEADVDADGESEGAASSAHGAAGPANPLYTPEGAKVGEGGAGHHVSHSPPSALLRFSTSCFFFIHSPRFFSTWRLPTA